MAIDLDKYAEGGAAEAPRPDDEQKDDEAPKKKINYSQRRRSTQRRKIANPHYSRQRPIRKPTHQNQRRPAASGSGDVSPESFVPQGGNINYSELRRSRSGFGNAAPGSFIYSRSNRRGNASTFYYSNYRRRSRHGGSSSPLDAPEVAPGSQGYPGTSIVPAEDILPEKYFDYTREIDRSGLGTWKYRHSEEQIFKPRSRLKDYMRRDFFRKLDNKASEYTQDNVATGAAHTYGRYAARPVSRTGRKIYNKAWLAKERMKSKIAQNGGKISMGIIGDTVKFFLTPKHPTATVAMLVIVGGLFLILAYFNMMSGTVITLITSFTADEATSSGVVDYLQELDAGLVSEIENIPDGYNDIDEVNISFDGVIATNPTHIMAYLTVMYNDFTLDQVRADLKEIHQTLYTVEKEVETQKKHRTESYTEIDPETGEEHSGEREVEYEYRILHITVTCRQFSDYVAELIDPGDMDWYELLVETGGNMMLGGNLGNPFVGVDWRNFVTTPYGYRINPVDHRREFHPAIDISWGGINGTPINAVHDGIVIRAVHGDSTYGNYIMLEDTEQNLRTRYSHCSSLLVSVGQDIKRGDEVGLVGSTGKSTGPHLDIEVYRNGKHVNPITELSFN